MKKQFLTLTTYILRSIFLGFISKFEIHEWYSEISVTCFPFLHLYVYVILFICVYVFFSHLYVYVCHILALSYPNFLKTSHIRFLYRIISVPSLYLCN